MSKPLTAVTSMTAAEVSLVDRGANQKKRFPLFKSEDLMDKDILKAVLETEVDGEAQLADILAKSELTDAGKAAATATVRLFSSFKKELPAKLIDQLAIASGIKKAEDAENEEELDETAKAKKKADDAAKAKGDEEEEEAADAAKAKGDEEMSDDIRKQLETRDVQLVELRKQNEEFQKSLKVERDARELAVWVAKAKADLSHYPGKNADELGAMLKTLHDTSPEIANAQFDQMKVASESLKESSLLKSAGAAGGGVSGGSTWDKIEKLADGYIEKAATNMTKAQAISKVIEMNPEMYSAYLNENPKQLGN